MPVFGKKILFLALLIAVLHSCKSSYITNNITKKIETPFYDNQFTGLLVYNPKTNDTVVKYHADKYFIPASNTKIFTLYTALNTLPNRIPSFKYTIKADTITIQGTGDPTFLHPFFNDSTALKMARNYKKVNLVWGNLEDDKFGPGWAWEDYDTYFSPERSSFPMYGNVVTINGKDSLQSTPKALKQNIQYSETSKRRNYNDNIFFYNLKKRRDTIEIPMVIDTFLIEKLWQSILPGKISISNYAEKKMEYVAYSVPSDSLYKRMMEISDNFLAEQMLILCSSVFSDTLSSSKMRERILENELKDLKHPPRWVDGSGLSRYNLFTPTSFVQVLTKLYNEIPQERLFNLFPVGGKSGTLKKYYSGNEKPYIYAKSGTVGNNYSLSGYLITNSGKMLIFSFMNNHYTNPTGEVKKHMQSVLEWLRDNY
ncbi:D-alanyl-D-alanine carboxypeptidase/D-alanyl-D-alanine-endopeptidase [Changchengzhania lutea]|uniref:D-alanyl-D-alanine carboxypeptidase/D-alanyl-D-alanine-endopeptidase n=1 Tax=Changchengzhania lutea TaxID=2049305 RepID=UPI00115ED271|nr:D-alanyl-D-alanine carboxypeptidase [Changchengzhania lutea]